MNDWPYTSPLLRVFYGVHKDNFTLTLHETIICNKFSNPNSQRDEKFYLKSSILASCCCPRRYAAGLNKLETLISRLIFPYSATGEKKSGHIFCSEYYQSFKIWELIFMNT